MPGVRRSKSNHVLAETRPQRTNLSRVTPRGRCGTPRWTSGGWTDRVADVVTSTQFVGAGIYSIPEASRLTRVSSSRIRRWLKGYDFKATRERHHSNPVWQGQLDAVDGKLAVGFRDLVEIRFVAAFIAKGVSWKTMRHAHAAAQQKLSTAHPFCTNRFVTDGREILLEQAEGESDKVLVDLTTNQQEFDRIVQPFVHELEFADETTLIRWWPLGKQRAVVLDPVRNFGQPTASGAGVPTRVLARSVKANGGSIELVARWYEVAPDEVRDAVEFESGLALAA